MPAVSKAQQKFMGIVHGIQKGDIKPGEVSAKAQKVAKTISKKDAKGFATTKHKGLPEKVPENYIVDENTLTDLPDDVEYGYTRDGVVQCIASKNTCLTRMQTDRERNPGSKFQFIYSPTQQVGEMFESINEIKSDQDMVKDGLKYAKKKYKYDNKKLKDLAKDTLQYIKSGEIDDEPSMEAYIDFRHDEISMDEGQFTGSIASDARGLSSGTIASLTGKQKHDEIQKIQNDFVKFASQNKTKYKNWHDAWRVFWKQNEIKEVIRGIVREVLNEDKTPKKGDQISVGEKTLNAKTLIAHTWIIEYMDSSHIKMALAWSGKPKKFAVYNVGQLKDKPYYKDLVKWMRTGDDTIDQKKY